MKLIVGLGNPDKRYFLTRHNAGRLLVELIARHFSLKWQTKKSLHASFAAFRWDQEEIVLAYPEVYMNVSGEALGPLIQHFNLEASGDLLVVVDDVTIPFGTLRLRGKGSSGGHNGLKSIEAILQTSQYARLRMGIGPEEVSSERDLETFVLERFNQKEQKELPEFLKKAETACQLWATKTLQQAMNVVNPVTK